MIRNVIFDVGNVFVCWSPSVVVERCFGLKCGTPENAERSRDLFSSDLWIAMNRGELSQKGAELAYSERFGLSPSDSQTFFFHVMDHQVAIEGTEDLAIRLKEAGYGIFGLTDNIREIVAYLKVRHNFWPLFDGVVVSAEVGMMKPDRRIFEQLIDTFKLVHSETVFLDDMSYNVEGARSSGLQAFVFTSAADAERDLKGLGMNF